MQPVLAITVFVVSVVVALLVAFLADPGRPPRYRREGRARGAVVNVSKGWRCRWVDEVGEENERRSAGNESLASS